MVLDMNEEATTQQLLEQLHEDLTGTKDTSSTPQSLRFAYVKIANDSLVTTLLGHYGLNYVKFSSMQDGIDEYQFSCDEGTYRSLFANVVGTGLAIYLSNNRLPIQGAIGTINVTSTPSSPSTLIDNTAVATAVPQQLSTTSISCQKIKIKTKITASVDADGYAIYYGNSTSQNYPLFAGESTEIQIDDVSKIYIKRAGGSNNTVYYSGS